MAGNQFAFNYFSDSEIKAMFDTNKIRLNQYFDDYNLTEYDIRYVQLAIRQKDKKLLYEFFIYKDIPVYISDVDNNFIKDNLSISISVNEDSLGKPLDVKVTNGAISHLYLEID